MDTGLIIGLTGIVGLTLQFYAGSTGDKYGKWRVLGFGVLISVIVSPLLLLINNLSIAYIIIPIVLGANSISMPMFTALVGDALPLEERGSGYGAYGIVRDVSLIIGSPLGGIVLETSKYFSQKDLFYNLQILFIFRFLMLALTLAVVVYYMKSFKEVDSVIWLRSKVPVPE